MNHSFKKLAAEGPYTITADDLESLAVGSWILGTGGGGNTYIGLLNMRRLYEAGSQVTLIDPNDLADDDDVAVVSYMGAPLVGQERLGDPDSVAKSVEMMEEVIGRKFTAIMSLEIGGSNGIQPLMAAALLNRPVVDADCMGRAFPEAQMTSFAIGDLQPYPFALYDPRGIEVVVKKVPTWKWMERVSRKICVEVGSIAATCKAPRTGLEVKEWGIHHTTSQAIALGQCVREAQRLHNDPIAAILDHAGGIKLFSGKIIDVDRRTTGGFLRGRAKITGLDADKGRELEIDFQNEWVIAREGENVIATTPDLICMLDSDSGEGLGTEVVRYGQRVTMIALPAPAVLTSPKGLEHVGPRAFGYDLDFRPLFGTESGEAQ
ncbi:MAG: DUF917 family protein [Cellvibrionaceae bacterium]|jgi:DUF917 family protein